MSRICVKSLSKSTTEKTLRETFSKKGEVTDVRLMKTSSGKSRQFAFIGFRDDKDATEAIKYFNNTYIDTYKVIIEAAKKLDDASLGDARSKYTKKKLEKIRKEQEKGEKELKAIADDKKTQKSEKKTDPTMKGDKDLEEFLEVMKSRSSKNKWGNDEALRDEQDRGDSMEIAGGNSDGDHSDGSSSGSDEEYDDIDDNVASKSADKTSKVVSDMDFLRSKIKRKVDSSSDDESDESDEEEAADEEKIGGGDDAGEADDCENERDKKGKTKSSAKTSAKKSEKNNVDVEKGAGDSNETDMKVENSITNSHKKGDRFVDNNEEVDESGRLFVRNLSFTCEESELRVLFEPFGTLTSIHIPLGKDVKKSSGFAFVEYMLPECAKRAKETLDGSSFQGRLLHVLFAKEEPEFVGYSATTGLDSNGRKLSSFQLKKEEDRRKMINRKDGLNASFVRSDAVIDALADRYGIRRVDILDTNLSSSEIVLRQALAEAQIIEENRNYFIAKNINLNVLESFHNKDASTKRSATTLLIKNLPFDMVPDELEQMFAKYGAIRSFLVPPSRTICLIDFIEASECRKAFKTLNYRNYKKMPLYIEYAPIGTINFTPDNSNSSSNKGSSSNSNSKSNGNDSKLEQFLNQLNNSSDNNDKNVSQDNDNSNSSIKHSISSSRGNSNIFSNEGDDDDGDDFSTLFIKNLNFTTTEASLVEFITKKLKLEGLRSVSIQLKKSLNNDGMVSMGFGFVEFRSKDFAVKAQKAMNAATLESHTLEVKPSDKRISVSKSGSSAGKGSSGVKSSSQQNTKLLVKNVPFQATISELKALFSSFGAVRKVRIPKTMSATHRGFAFVEFNTHFEAENAMKALKQTHLYGRHLVIEWAQLDDADTNDSSGGSSKTVSGIPSSKNGISQLRKRAQMDANVISANQSKKKRMENSDPTSMDSFGSNKSRNDEYE